MKRSIQYLACGVALYGGTMITSATAASSAAGQAIFAAKCKTCHGADGTANPAIAKMFNVTMKPLGSAEVQAKTDAQLKTIITMGTGKMKPVTGIVAADADNVVAYLRTLKK